MFDSIRNRWARDRGGFGGPSDPGFFGSFQKYFLVWLKGFWNFQNNSSGPPPRLAPPSQIFNIRNQILALFLMDPENWVILRIQ